MRFPSPPVAEGEAQTPVLAAWTSGLRGCRHWPVQGRCAPVPEALSGVFTPQGQYSLAAVTAPLLPCPAAPSLQNGWKLTPGRIKAKGTVIDPIIFCKGNWLRFSL